MNKVIDYLVFKVIRLSGLLWFLSLLFTALATGQAEISYTFWFIGNVMSLLGLIAARFRK